MDHYLSLLEYASSEYLQNNSEGTLDNSTLPVIKQITFICLSDVQYIYWSSVFFLIGCLTNVTFLGMTPLAPTPTLGFYKLI